MTAEQTASVTFEQYVQMDTGEQRLEWVAGHVYAMAGGSQRHGLMVTAISDRLREGARRARCRRYSQGHRLKTATASYYPDVFLSCGPDASDSDQYEVDASIVVEVLGPSTRVVDRREKAMTYSALPSFEAYLLVDPDRKRVEVASRAGDGTLRWESFEAAGIVDTPYGQLALDELYAEVDALARRQTEQA